MNETSLCAIKEGMFLSVFDENWQFPIRMGMIIKFYAMAVIKTEENEQSQFRSNVSKVICISSVNKLMADTQANVIFNQRRMFFGKILHSEGKY